MKNENGMTLIEMLFVLAMFAAITYAINSTIFSAHTLWSGSKAFTDLEKEALDITRQIAGDLEKAAVMMAPPDTGLSFSDRLPHIGVTGGNDTDGYYGDNITFLVPTYSSDGEPLLRITSNDIGVDWSKGRIISYSVVTVNGKRVLRRTSTKVDDSTDTNTIDLTDKVVYVRFRDRDTDYHVKSYYEVIYEIRLQSAGPGGRVYTVTRSASVYLRNSRGAEDL